MKGLTYKEREILKLLTGDRMRPDSGGRPTKWTHGEIARSYELSEDEVHDMETSGRAKIAAGGMSDGRWTVEFDKAMEAPPDGAPPQWERVSLSIVGSSAIVSLDGVEVQVPIDVAASICTSLSFMWQMGEDVSRLFEARLVHKREL